MVKAGMHLGHPMKHWNPQMKPFLYERTFHSSITKEKKVNLHVIDLIKTIAHAQYVSALLTKLGATNKKILFVGTHRQYAALVAKTAKVCNAHYINEKWLGGMLTNWDTVSLSIQRLRKYDVIVNDGTLASLPKKEAAKALKEKTKLHRLFGGIKFLTEKPDFVIILGQLKEINAVKECKKLNIPTLSIADTNCDPMASDLLVPANDDSTASLQAIFNMIAFSICRGQLLLNQKPTQLSTQTSTQIPDQFKRIYSKTMPLSQRQKLRRQRGKIMSSVDLEGEKGVNQKKQKSNPFKPSFFTSVSTAVETKTETPPNKNVEQLNISPEITSTSTKQPQEKTLLPGPAWTQPKMNINSPNLPGQDSKSFSKSLLESENA